MAATVDAGTEGSWAEKVLTEGNIVAPALVLVEATNILRRLAADQLNGRTGSVSSSRHLKASLPGGGV